MKKIFVTIAEFTRNGGEMIKQSSKRKIYYQNGISVSIYDDELYNHIIENQSHEYYVQIDCTRIYK